MSSWAAIYLDAYCTHLWNLRTAKLWNASTGGVQHTVQFDGAWGSCCMFSPDSTALLVGMVPLDQSGYDLKLFNTNTYEHQWTFKGHVAFISSCSFAPNGTTILSASEDSTMKLWCVVTGQLLRTLEGHTDSIISCAFSPTGRAIVSGSCDGTLRLWDTPTGRQQIIDITSTFAGKTICMPGRVTSVSFSPDGESILGSTDGTMKRWRYKEKVGLLRGPKVRYWRGAPVSMFCSNVSVKVQEAMRRLVTETPGSNVEFLTDPAEIAERGTHLITNSVWPYLALKRTEEYMKAILNGIWVLDDDWIMESLKHGELRPEEDHEVRGDVEGGMADCFHGPRRARRMLCRVESGSCIDPEDDHRDGMEPEISNGINRGSLLFSDYEFYLMDDFVLEPSKILLESLIKLGGGEILSRKRVAEDKAHSAPQLQIPKKCIIVSGATYFHLPGAATVTSSRPDECKVMTYSWVLDCISKYDTSRLLCDTHSSWAEKDRDMKRSIAFLAGLK